MCVIVDDIIGEMMERVDYAKWFEGTFKYEGGNWSNCATATPLNTQFVIQSHARIKTDWKSFYGSIEVEPKKGQLSFDWGKND